MDIKREILTRLNEAICYADSENISCCLDELYDVFDVIRLCNMSIPAENNEEFYRLVDPYRNR